MTPLDKLKEKADGYDIKKHLYYLEAIGFDGERAELYGYYSYCEDCINDVVSDFNAELKEKGSEVFHEVNFVNSYYFKIQKIVGSQEYSPERDSFTMCEKCYELIDTQVLHAFSHQEIEALLPNSLKIENLSNRECYVIYELLTSDLALEKHPEEIEELKAKFHNDNIIAL
ncbi:hypothetical protein [Riemerella anatipestifer]|uniref:hypothetical protein n=1 Tax=Riemerella anatipestifer TaxID=34085 RepID=UPI0007EC9B05|nr:hypothetical protein [Riemerella anatipestifer]WIT94482.1 hypothetical protein CRP19_000051 [Riemerella phage vB_RanS_CRP19]MCU7570439.1 hypothetical protein [Riemerella anatipestifer]MCW0507983.1 hypothetical protein [Riemerella anatipestifer]MCW0518250.1 hypothetical protein [Riemerella anatipestifer]MDR7846555.1 hypothetical protein [Riemerella anatipestifer]